MVTLKDSELINLGLFDFYRDYSSLVDSRATSSGCPSKPLVHVASATVGDPILFITPH